MCIFYIIEERKIEISQVSAVSITGVVLQTRFVIVIVFVLSKLIYNLFAFKLELNLKISDITAAKFLCLVDDINLSFKSPDN